jgi:hypothetical protein
MIDAGVIDAIGFRYVGTRLPQENPRDQAVI